jgi:NADPH2:quinone reductase
MKAILCSQYCQPDDLVLADVPDPVAEPGQAVIAIKAAALNFFDILMIQGKYQIKPPFPFSPAAEVAGVIESVGAGVTDLKVGDRVMGNCSFGGLAEVVRTEPHRLITMPDAMPFDEGAAFILAYGTSYYALKWRGRLKAGETVLVLGAAGGVGIAAIEIGKALGARVIAACSTQEKLEFARSVGADDGILYPRGALDRDAQKALSEQFRSVCGPKGPDVIYDAIGGDYAEPAFRSIAWDGRYLVVGFAAGDIPRIPLNLPLLKGADIVGVFWGSWIEADPTAFSQHLDELKALYEAGMIRPRIYARFPLEKGGEAIAQLGDRKVLGKVVVTTG